MIDRRMIAAVLALAAARGGPEVELPICRSDDEDFIRRLKPIKPVAFRMPRWYSRHAQEARAAARAAEILEQRAARRSREVKAQKRKSRIARARP